MKRNVLRRLKGSNSVWSSRNKETEIKSSDIISQGIINGRYRTKVLRMLGGFIEDLQIGQMMKYTSAEIKL